MFGALLPAIIGAGAALIGSSQQADAQQEAAEQSQQLPPWLEPYMTGQYVPQHISGSPLINTNWMDYITQLGQGNYNAPWQPMVPQSPWFNPDQTFTPGPATPDMPYGTLSPDQPGYTTPGPAPMPAEPAPTPAGPSYQPYIDEMGNLMAGYNPQTAPSWMQALGLTNQDIWS